MSAVPRWRPGLTRWRPGLRLQWLALALGGLLLLPMLHERYVGELHQTLQEAQKAALLGLAPAYAAALQGRRADAVGSPLPEAQIERSGYQVWWLDVDLKVQQRWGSLVRKDPLFMNDSGDAVRAPDWLDRLALQGLHPLLQRRAPPLTDAERAAAPLIDDVVHAARQGSIGLRAPAGSGEGAAPQAYAVAAPIWSASGEVTGVLLVEQGDELTGRVAQHLRERLLLTTLLGFGLIGGAFVWYAGRLARRILLLQRGTEQAHDERGRLQRAALPEDPRRDEIGELSRSIVRLLLRLDAQREHLQKFARLLTHELRTPLTMIRASLENLDEQQASPAQTVYFDRAQRGIERINLVLSSMSEASQLDAQLVRTPRIHYDLAAFLRDYVDAFACARPDRIFEMRVASQPLPVFGHPEWAAQMVDKLLSNACDFATPGTAIVVEALAQGPAPTAAVRLRVCNQGPTIEAGRSARLFEPFASERPPEAGGGAGDAPHLGIGLHVARLVAQYHGGEIRCVDRDDGAGVVFEITLPRSAHAG